MNVPRLTFIRDLNGPAACPDYTPENHGCGIVHLGFGAFHRAHQAVMTDDALARDGGDWRIIGVSLRSTDVAGKVNTQNGLYTLIEKGPSGQNARVIGAVDHVIAVDPVATLNALKDPNIRVVTLTVTEKGYGIDPASGAPDVSNAAVAADLMTPENPQGVLGLLTAAIDARRIAGHPTFTVLSCDNLPQNGDLLRTGVIEYARLSGRDDLADWIAKSVAFPCSMVDRITPAATQSTRDDACAATGCDDQAAIETEPFSQWVIEDDFTSGRPGWEAGGALFVPDVTPYETMKLTMLNGSHSLLAYSGFLLGCRYVRDVMQDPDLSWLVGQHLKAAAAGLPPLDSINFNMYANDLQQRFANPAIAHETFQIAADGTQKLPQRIFQPAVAALQTGRDTAPFAFATAMWMRFCLCARDDGMTYELHDPRAAELTAVLEKTKSSATAISDAIHGLSNLVPSDLTSSSAWRGQVETCLSNALSGGCRAAVRSEINQEEAQKAPA